MSAASVFDRQPVLEGRNVRIRPMRPDDLEALYAVAGDPAVWAQHPASDRHLRPVFERMFEESIASQGAMVVEDKASGAVIGSSRYHLADPSLPRVEIGWSYLARSHWGGETNREVKTLLLTHAFRFVEVVSFRVGEANLRSRRAMEKIGGVLTSAREAVVLPSGVSVTHVVYEIRRGDFTSDQEKRRTF